MTSFTHTDCGLVMWSPTLQRSHSHIQLKTSPQTQSTGKTVDRSEARSLISAQLSLVSSLVAGSDIPENGGGADVESDTQQSIVRHSD